MLFVHFFVVSKPRGVQNWKRFGKLKRLTNGQIMVCTRNSYRSFVANRNCFCFLSLVLFLLTSATWFNIARKRSICTNNSHCYEGSNVIEVENDKKEVEFLSELQKDVGHGACCHQCTFPENTCCMACSDVSSPREHDMLMALNEGLTFHIMDKYPNSSHEWLKTRAWEGVSHIGNRREQATFYYDWIRSLDLGFDIRHVCEIGMNGGHSALIFLAALTTGNMENDAHLTMFDLGAFEYSNNSQEYIEVLYPGRFTLYSGDSKKILPQWKMLDSAEKCDVFSIDGDHSYDGVKADIINASEASRPRAMVILDDMGPGTPTRAAFDDAVKEGLLANPKCIEHMPTLVSYINRFDQDNVRRLGSSWCFASVL